MYIFFHLWRLPAFDALWLQAVGGAPGRGFGGGSPRFRDVVQFKSLEGSLSWLLAAVARLTLFPRFQSPTTLGPCALGGTWVGNGFYTFFFLKCQLPVALFLQRIAWKALCVVPHWLWILSWSNSKKLNTCKENHPQPLLKASTFIVHTLSQLLRNTNIVLTPFWSRFQIILY